MVWWVAVARPGRGLLGLDVTRGQDSKLKLRGAAPWLPESDLGACKHLVDYSRFRLAEGTGGWAKYPRGQVL